MMVFEMAVVLETCRCWSQAAPARTQLRVQRCGGERSACTSANISRAVVVVVVAHGTLDDSELMPVMKKPGAKTKAKAKAKAKASTTKVTSREVDKEPKHDADELDDTSKTSKRKSKTSAASAIRKRYHSRIWHGAYDEARLLGKSDKQAKLVASKKATELTRIKFDGATAEAVPSKADKGKVMKVAGKKGATTKSLPSKVMKVKVMKVKEKVKTKVAMKAKPMKATK